MRFGDVYGRARFGGESRLEAAEIPGLPVAERLLAAVAVRPASRPS